MRFHFRQIPDPVGTGVRPRPIVDVVVEGLELAPQACLLDSGAGAVRMGAHVAELAGIEIGDAPRTTIAVGGALVVGRVAEVALEVSDGRSSYQWAAPVWFCEPWRPAFGLLGLTGFFDHFEVTVAAYEEWLTLTPVSE
ncbi:MAG: hypothetical protein WA484_05240 [Solirubrobacteraceae bacterium]